MAKRRKTSNRRKYFTARAAPRRRASFTKKRRTTRHKRSSFLGGLTPVIAAAGYGALREKIADIMSPLTSKIPIAGYADEIGLGVVSYLLAHKKIPVIKKFSIAADFGKAGLMIEAARLGSEIANQKFNSSSNAINKTPMLQATVF